MVTKLKNCVRPGNNAVASGINLSLQRTLEMETPGFPKILRSDPQQMHLHLAENLKFRKGGRVTPRWLSTETFRPVQEPPPSRWKVLHYTTVLLLNLHSGFS